MHLVSALSVATTASSVVVAQHEGHEHGDTPTHQRADDHALSDDARRLLNLYPLTVCPISGEKLGSMGEPVVRKYDDREVRFCCAGCIDEFEADLDTSWRKVDEAIVKDQLRYYPVQTCIVSGEPLTEDGKDIATNMVYGNRLIRLCCKICQREFKADPGKFLERLDKSVTESQRKDYPLATCPVSSEPLGSMGEPVELLLAGRLVRLCCSGCKPKILADPAKYIQAIDTAWQARGKFLPQDHEAGQDDHGKHQHTDDHGSGG
jgi:hypothetical protein